MKFGLREIPSGQAGTDETVRIMAGFVQKALRSPKIRMLALSILKVAGVTSKQPDQVAIVLYDYVKNNISYISDPVGVETVQDPIATIELSAGDCDDHSVLLASLFESVGLSTRFVVIGNDPENFQHIYIDVLIRNRWTPADTTIEKPFGRSVSMMVRKIYNSKGVPMRNNLGTPAREVFPQIPMKTVEYVAYRSAYQRLRDLWQSSKIGVDDLSQYLNIIDKGNAPEKNSPIERPIRLAVQNFLKEQMRSSYSTMQMNRLSGVGLGDYFGDLWSGVKKNVGDIVRDISVGEPTGSEAPGSIVIRPPDINIPEGLIQTTVSPEAAKSAALASTGAFLSHPLVVGVALLAVTAIIATSQKRRS